MKTLKYILAVLAVATSVAMPQPSFTKSEVDDARDSANAFETMMTKFHKADDWTPLLNELENAAKRYVGKSKIQIAMLPVAFPNLPAELKTTLTLTCVKLDAAAAQAIRFTQAWRECLALVLEPKPTDDAESRACDQAEIERQKYFAATKEWGAAALAFGAAAKK